jgi:hypothetical protein
LFFTSNNNQELFDNAEKIGLKQEIINKKNILIKINLSQSYIKNHPRTDIAILRTVIDYIYENGGKCALMESANGYLLENLIISGFGDILKKYEITVIDGDIVDYCKVLSNGEQHYIPKCLQEYPLRIAIPATSKRKNMIYSNNIKLFVGAVPRKMYQLDVHDAENNAPRPKIHQNLHLSVANLFLAIQNYSPFQFYINGGLSFNENIGEFTMNKTFIGNDALELDCHLFHTFFNECEYPEYLNILV